MNNVLKKINNPIYDLLNEGIVIFDNKNNLKYANKNFCAKSKTREEELINKKLNTILNINSNFCDEIMKNLQSSGFWKGEIKRKSKNEDVIQEKVSIFPLTQEKHNHNGIICIFEDISKEQNLSEKIKNLLYYNQSTNLPTKLWFEELLNSFLEYSFYSQKHIGVLIFSIDTIKKISSVIKYNNVSDILISTTNKINSFIVKNNGFMAQISDKEIGLIFANLNHKAELLQIISSLKKILEEPLLLKGNQSLYITASIGAALYPDDGFNTDELIKNSYLAFGKAKKNGGNSFCIYSKDIFESLSENFSIEDRLKNSINNFDANFNLVFQPQYNMITGEIVGAETLIRWNDKKLGFVSPAKFIPIAEESGIIHELGNWIISTANKYIKQLNKEGFKGNISINLSPLQLSNVQLLNTLESMNFDYPEQIEFEITESAFSEDNKNIVDFFAFINTKGFKISIDDFGMGYSNLSNLHRFKIDKLKIDRYYVTNSITNEKVRDITKIIISIAKTLNIDLIAEGVETKEELDFLLENKCFKAQGYYYSKPVSFEEFLIKIQNNKV